MKYSILIFGILVVTIIFLISTSNERIGEGVIISQRGLKSSVISVVQMEYGKRISTPHTNPLLIEGDEVDVFLCTTTLFGTMIDQYHIIHPIQKIGELVAYGKVIGSIKKDNLFLIQMTDGVDTFNVEDNRDFKINTNVRLYIDDNKHFILKERKEWMDTIFSPKREEALKFSINKKNEV